MRDWDKELAKIDRQLESLSDEKLLESSALPMPGRPAPEGAAPPGPRPQQPTRATAAGAGVAPAGAGSARQAIFGVGLRLGLAGALAVAIVFWPYPASCGLGLLGYAGAVGGVVLAGVWTAVWTWRRRAPRAHVVSLLLAGWGLALVAAEILPRAGYAKPDPARSVWVCE